MNSITSAATIEKLRECIGRFGLPNTIVSDNGRQFVSNEFNQFCLNNKIKHLTTAPYHPQSNGAAENSVKTFKTGMQKALADPKNSNSSIETLMNRFLFYYRSSVHSTTLETPYKLMFGREMKTHFDRIKPSRLAEMCDDAEASNTQQKATMFTVNDKVLVRDHQNPKQPWKNAIITAVMGKRMYKCKTEEGEWRRHADQIIPSKSKSVISTHVIDNDFSISSNRFSIDQQQATNDVEPRPSMNTSASAGASNAQAMSPDLTNETNSSDVVSVSTNQAKDTPPPTPLRKSNRNCRSPNRWGYSSFK